MSKKIEEMTLDELQLEYAKLQEENKGLKADKETSENLVKKLQEDNTSLQEANRYYFLRQVQKADIKETKEELETTVVSDSDLVNKFFE